MDKKIKIKKKYAALLIIGLIFAVIAFLHLLGVFHFLEYKSYDMRVRFWADSTFSRPSDEIIVILLDQDSLDWAQKERGWGWPWPRQAYAEIVDYMNLSGAKSLAFDVIFSEPSVYKDTGDDASFIEASGNYGRVVQTVMFSSQTGSALSWPSGLNKPLFQPENFGSMLERFSLGPNEKGQFPISGLSEAAGALGSITGIPDSDGVIRRIRPFTLFDGKAVPGLSAASLIVSGKGRQITFNSKTGVIDWDGFSIPVGKNGATLLRYRGEFDRYNPYRAMDILKSADAAMTGDNAYMSTNNYLPPENFKDAYVFFGFYAQGLFDIFSTPISSVYPGMGCHITMLDNMLKGDFVRESAGWLNLLILLIAALAVVFLTMFSKRIPVSLGGTVLILAAIIAGSFAAFQWGGLWVPMVTFIAGVLASFITVTLYNYATEGSQKRFIKSAFSQYLSPKVIDQIIQDPSQLKQGGKKREMTAIFTDVRSFSTISDALGDPTKLVELLNFYLTRMSNIVLDNQGTIDKYEGDAIIAFFGAPVHMKNHASLACRAAVCMKKAEAVINREALAQGLITEEVMKALAAKGIIESTDDPSPLFTRLGVNTGEMVVGNMGTPSKMDYTIMGNAVNLAARLEGVNKQYDTGGILISEYTRDQIGDEFILRPLSRVRVVGINTPLRLYELLDIASQAPVELPQMVKSWEEAFALYEKRDFTAARNIFQSICEKNDADKTAQKFLKRCVKFIDSAPDEKAWDGVDNLTEK
jgi:adenylate cyclase